MTNTGELSHRHSLQIHSQHRKKHADQFSLNIDAANTQRFKNDHIHTPHDKEEETNQC